MEDREGVTGVGLSYRDTGTPNRDRNIKEINGHVIENTGGYLYVGFEYNEGEQTPLEQFGQKLSGIEHFIKMLDYSRGLAENYRNLYTPTDSKEIIDWFSAKKTAAVPDRADNALKRSQTENPKDDNKNFCALQTDENKLSSPSSPNYLSTQVANSITGMGIYDQIQRHIALYTTLKGLQSEHVGWKRMVVPYNDAANALITIMNYQDTITKVSSGSGIPKELIQAVLFREQIFYNIADETDVARVRFGHKTGLDKYDQFKSASIGLGQIFPETAIEAEREIRGAVFSWDEMFERLQDENTNIHYVGLVLAYEAGNLNIDIKNAKRQDLEKLLARYNGTGDAAAQYGRETYLYYEAFCRYNQKEYE